MSYTSESKIGALDIDFSDFSRDRDWMDFPEQRLLWAIVERCVRDALGNHSEEVEQAVEWLWACPEQTAAPFTFQWICEVLDLDGKQLKEKVVAMRETLQKTPLSIEPCNHAEHQLFAA